VLVPTQTLGDAQAPRLTLVTDGLTRLSIGVDRAEQYQGTVTVQDNLRQPLPSTASASIEQFLSTDLAKALKSQRLFFITARRNDTGKLVSSRYERVDFDAILVRLEENCPFAAEALMTDVYPRERAERSLGVSQSDLMLIRWALNKRYNGSSSQPEPRPVLSQAERIYLRRYAAENGLPASLYLTSEVVQKLRSEGTTLANLAKPALPPVGSTPPWSPLPSPITPPPPVYSDYFTFKLCNRSKVTISLAVNSRVSPTDTEFNIQGWWTVNQGDCTNMTFPKGWFYFYGEQRNSGGKKFWGSSAAKFCVIYPGPFSVPHGGPVKCDPRRLKGFNAVLIGREQDEYSINLNP
jgi:uncharacterized membrane protein